MKLMQIHYLFLKQGNIMNIHEIVQVKSTSRSQHKSRVGKIVSFTRFPAPTYVATAAFVDFGDSKNYEIALSQLEPIAFHKPAFTHVLEGKAVHIPGSYHPRAGCETSFWGLCTLVYNDDGGDRANVVAFGEYFDVALDEIIEIEDFKDANLGLV